MSDAMQHIIDQVNDNGVALVDSSLCQQLKEQFVCGLYGKEVLDQLQSEVDEADKRAGRAERLLDYEKESNRKRADWLEKAKHDAGYSSMESFDKVWDEALTALLEKRSGYSD